MSEIRGSEIRVSEIRVSEIRISSNHRELHGAIFSCSEDDAAAQVVTTLRSLQTDWLVDSKDGAAAPVCVLPLSGV